MMTINLFDNTFRHDVCSTAWKTPKHIQYVRDRMEFDGVTMFTDGYINSNEPDRVNSPIKIGWLHEPDCLIPNVYEQAASHAHKFAFILTYRDDLLERRGFRFAPYGGTWIKEEHWGMRPKSGLCSMLIGTKAATEGHRLRPQLADALEGAGLSVRFFGARGEPVNYSPETKLKVLGDFAFSIVVEACRSDNLFTEILLDCFTVGTIPIFWGAPNIARFFDANGILSFNSIEECVEIVRGLSFDLYENLSAAAQNNLAWVKPYAVTEDWLYQNVLRDLSQ